MQEPSRDSQAPESESSFQQNQLGLLLAILLSLWTALVIGLPLFMAWTSEQIMMLMGLEWPNWLWFFISVTQSLLIAIAAVPLAWLWPGERHRPVFRTLAIAALFVFVLSPLRLVQPPATSLANFLQILLVGLVLTGLLLIRRFRSRAKTDGSIRDRSGLLLALIIAAIVLYPWLAWGALGSMLDTVLNLTASLLFGLTVAFLLSEYLLKPIRRTSAGIGRDLLLSGLASGAALLAMAAAFGFNGLQLLLILVIPALCVSAAGVGWYGQIQDEKTSWLAIAALVGLSTAAPMMFVDPDELNLILAFGTRDIPYWAFTAAVISMIIGLTFSAAFLLYRRFLSGLKPLKPLAAVLSLSWVVGIVIFLGTGQPGLHGDQLFVILSEQANLDEFAGQVDIDEKQDLIYRTLVDQAKESQADIQRALERVGIDYTPYYLVNALAVNGGPLLKFWLESRPEVDRVLENPILRPLPTRADSSEGGANGPLQPMWNLTQIGADRVWNELGVTGEGIVVGHADSGVQWDHPELIDSYRGVTEGHDYNWYDPWFETLSPTDSSGHGTHTLGTLVGRSVGLAPGAQWFGCANLVRGLGNPALYLDCLQFLFAPYPAGGDPFLDGEPERAAHIVSNSWLCPEIEGCDQYTLVEAASAMRTAGIFMVVSAGNEGPWCSSIESPMAIFEEVYSVGAIDQSGELAIFSSLGPVVSDGSGRTKPDLVAPGDGILSAFPGSSYEVQSGTSMAGPHVAGVVALMWSANPSLIGDIQQTERILAETATPFRGTRPACTGNGSLPNNAVGYGVVNAYEAVRASIALR